MSNVLISIAMTTYNGEKFLSEQLDSIYAQSYKNIELIVVDDCSTDRTVSILEEYRKKYGLKYYQNEKNIGFVKNFERAISLCTGDYIALSDQDDIWEKDKLQILVEEIGTNLLVHSDCAIIDQDNKLLQDTWKRETGYNIQVESLIFRNIVTGCTVLFKKELLNIALPFPNELVYHDWWLAILAALTNNITYTSKVLTRYRQHQYQDTGMNKENKSFILVRVFRQAYKRLRYIEYQRYQETKKHLQNLVALKFKISEQNKYISLIDDAIEYHKDYLQHHLHIKTFLIGLKYHHILYPERNYFYVRNILNDLVG